MKRNTDNMEIKRRSTFAILFYINRTKIRKDGTCQLLCKISIDAKWEQIGTKVSVNPAVWNPEKGRADGRSENAITVNRAIDDLTKEIKEHYRRIKNSLGFITAEQVKNAVMGVGQKPLTLLALFREHNEEFKKRIGVDRIKESYDSYLRSYKHLSAFVQEKRGIEDVLLRNLDRVFYDDFELFLRTNRNLSPKTVEDLYHRLGEFEIHQPSLCECPEDILPLANFFREKYSAELHRKRTGFTAEAERLLLSHSWSGNIRELQNKIRRAVLMAKDTLIDYADLNITPAIQTDASEAPLLPLKDEELEKQSIIRALQSCGGVKTKAAQMLNVDSSTLYRKMKKYGIK